MKKILFIGLILLLMFACKNDGVELPGYLKNTPPPESDFAISTNVHMVDGVQEVGLSFGSINYYPDMITVKSAAPVRIVADTSRLIGCFRAFEIPGLKIQKVFSETNDKLEFTPSKPGKFNFACSMGMGRGTLVVT